MQQPSAVRCGIISVLKGRWQLTNQKVFQGCFFVLQLRLFVGCSYLLAHSAFCLFLCSPLRLRLQDIMSFAARKEKKNISFCEFSSWGGLEREREREKKLSVQEETYQEGAEMSHESCRDIK